MKKQLLFLIISMVFITFAAGCNNEQTNEGNELEEDKKIVFGVTTWTSTEAPTNIAKLILEEAGYDVELTYLDQPVIFKGIAEQEVDFFMDAWLPYTEEKLWAKYEDDLQKVATSYEEVPLGWVVPSYVEEDTIDELVGNAQKFEERVVTIAPGAGNCLALSRCNCRL